MSIVKKKKKDSLSVFIEEETLFMHPTALATQPIRDDKILKGTVHLDLARDRQVRNVTVVLQGLCTLLGGDMNFPYHSFDILEKKIVLNTESLIPAGESVWTWSFIIPSSSPVFERCKYGTIKYWIRASCSVVNESRFKPSQIINSFPRPFYLVASPGMPGDLPEGLEANIHDTGRDVGPISLQLSSQHLTVSSLLYTNLTLDMPPDICIYSICAFICQSYVINYKDTDFGQVEPPSEKCLLFYVDETTPIDDDSLLSKKNISRGAKLPMAFEKRRLNPKPLVTVKKGEKWSFHRIVRIPDDDMIRPTTLLGTKSPIDIKHKLLFQIKYQRGGASKVLEICTPLTITSCCCMIDAFALPSYDSALGSPAYDPNARKPNHRNCLCNTSLMQIVKEQGIALEKANLQLKESQERNSRFKVGEIQSRVMTIPQSQASREPLTHPAVRPSRSRNFLRSKMLVQRLAPTA